MTSARALPIISHEVDFVNYPNDPAKPTPVWTALGAGNGRPVVSWTSKRGRQYELDRTEAGEMVATLDDTYDLSMLPTGSATVYPLQRWRTYALASPHAGNILNDGNSGLLYDPVSAVTGNFETTAQTIATAFTGTSASLSSNLGYLDSYAAYLNGTSVTSMSMGWVNANKRIPVLPNHTYLVSVMVSTQLTSSTVSFGLSGTDGVVAISTTLMTGVGSAAWTRYYGLYTTGATETAIRPVVTVTMPSQSNSLAIDCMSVEVVGRTNLCLNPSFEIGTTAHWTPGSNVTLSVASGQGRDGNAMLLTKGASGGPLASATTNFTAGVATTVTASAYVCSPSGVPVSGTIILADNGVQTVATFTTTGTGYQPVTVTRTLATTTNPQVLITLDPAPAGSTMLVDDVLIEFAPVQGAYFDGDSELCYWQGSHQASVSYMPNAPIPGGGTFAVPPAIRYNAHLNPSFEKNTNGWSGTTITRVAPGCHFTSGKFCASMTASTGGAISYALIPMQVTETLFSAWVRVGENYSAAGGTQTGTVSLTFSWYNGGTLVSSQTVPFTLNQSQGWTRLATVLTPPATTTQMTFGISWGADFNGSTIYADSFLVECYTNFNPSPGGSVTRPHFDTLTGAKIVPIFGGYAERWPNRIDADLRTTTDVTVIDAIGALAQIGVDSEYRANVLDSSPYMYWPLDEPQGSTQFADVTGNQVYDIHGVPGGFVPALAIDPSGTATGVGTQAGQPGPQGSTTATGPGTGVGATISVPQVPAFGDSGTAIEFSGVSATNVTGVSNDQPYSYIPGHTDMAMEAWIYPTANGISAGSVFIESRNDFYNSDNISVHLSSGNGVVAVIASGTNGTSLAGPVISINTWHHVAVSRWWNGTNYQGVLWVDFVQVASGTVAATTAAGGPWGSYTVSAGDTVWGAMCVGGYTSQVTGGPVDGFPGRVAHFAMYNKVLTNDQVASRRWHGLRGGLGETASWRARRYLNRYFNQPWKVEGAALTTAATIATATTIPVDSTLGFGAGDTIIVTNGAYANSSAASVSNFSTKLGTGVSYLGYTAEVATITSVDPVGLTITVSTGLSKGHDQGSYVMKGTQLSSNAALTSAGKLLPILQGVEVAEQGRFFCTADGQPYFMLRKSRYQTASSVAEVFLVQLADHGVPYLPGTEWDYDPTLLYNAVEISRQDSAGTTKVTATNPTSIKRVFRRDLAITLPIASTVEANSAVLDLVNTYSTPVERVQEIKVDLYANPLVAEKLLALELGDYVMVGKYEIANTGTQGANYPMVVENVALNASPGILELTLRLSPGSKSSTYSYNNDVSFR